ncbi:hypothetical protein GPECTOR_48g435 [Gonium pectorale]|uniref:Uncharacterized protein n=1 Tax=Gonium pectorale TaxID=33097 RepID=A0A150G8A9_GONPE|nr:hypothetical protein GPECTOR_48g435 [Gonium pectorale]|eukprot:KXZ46003.1 hypothetical protein GPECTOR_48g435 [Gonium pectorale]
MVQQLADYECPRAFVILPDDKGKVNPKSWFKATAKWFTDLSDSKEGSWLDSLTKRRFRLYLVCELSGELQGEGFPVDQSKDWVKKVLPAMKAGFKLLWLLNSTLKVAKAIAPAMFTVQGIEDSDMETAKKYLLHVSEDQFAEVGLSGTEGDGQMRSLVGAALQHFHVWLKQREWIGLLQRHYLEDGQRLVRWGVLEQIMLAFQAKQRESYKDMDELLRLGHTGSSGAGQQQPVAATASSTLPSPMLPAAIRSTPGEASMPPAISILEAGIDELMQRVYVPQLDGTFERLADCSPVQHGGDTGDQQAASAVYYLPEVALARMCVESSAYGREVFRKYASIESEQELYDSILCTLQACCCTAAADLAPAISEECAATEGALPTTGGVVKAVDLKQLRQFGRLRQLEREEEKERERREIEVEEERKRLVDEDVQNRRVEEERKRREGEVDEQERRGEEEQERKRRDEEEGVRKRMRK